MKNCNYLPVDSLPGTIQKYIKANLAEAFVLRKILVESKLIRMVK
jgi:hypothetical protein